MNKELIDRAWSILPKEFKEEVKKLYAKFYNEKPHSDCSYGYLGLLIKLFGIDNLTSDAEGEEMLTVPRSKVQEQYALNVNALREGNLTDMQIEIATKVKDTLYYLFGSKCLPDEPANEVNFATKEPKPAEPKFRKGDKFRYKKNPGEVYIVDFTNDGKVFYWDKDADGVSKMCIVNPEYIEPYTEPEEEISKMKPIESRVSVYLATKKEDKEFRQLLHENGFTWNAGIALISQRFWSSRSEEYKIHYVHPDKTVTYRGNRTSDTLTFSEFKKGYFGDSLIPPNSGELKSQEADKQFDNILKDGFRGHNRLHIAAMAMQGMLSNTTRFSSYEISDLVRISLNCADALIAEVLKKEVNHERQN